MNLHLKEIVDPLMPQSNTQIHLLENVERVDYLSPTYFNQLLTVDKKNIFIGEVFGKKIDYKWLYSELNSSQ